MSICYACNKSVKATEKISCSQCDSIYHHLCVNIPASSFKKTTREERSSWTCPKCGIGSPRPKDYANQPVGPIAERNTEESIRTIIRSEIHLAFKNELPGILKTILSSELAPLKQEVNDLKETVGFLSAQHDDFVTSITKTTTETKDLLARCNDLTATVQKLNNELNSLHQSLRESNIEMNGVPENKNENILTIVQQCARAVSHKILETDVLKCTRVAKRDKDDKRPRAIVVKFRSAMCRDQIYSAITRFNKANPLDKLNTSHLGFGGDKKPVFVSEHLSPYYKALHAASRHRAKELKYKFVWVRDGRIFMRKEENADVIFVKNREVLDSIH
jgi:uncharacterized protein YoxC